MKLDNLDYNVGLRRLLARPTGISVAPLLRE